MTRQNYNCGYNHNRGNNRLNGTTIGLLMALCGSTVLLTSPIGLRSAMAQSTRSASPSAELLKDPQSDALNNLFNNRGENATSGIFELMQRLGSGSTDPNAFRLQQRENLDAAAAEFRAQQRQMMRQPTTQPQTAQPQKGVPGR